MLLYLLKRILWFIPTLLAVTIIGFVLLTHAPGDPVDLLVNSTGSGGGIKTKSEINSQKKFWRKQLGLDLPLFYFSITKISEPDTLYKIDDQETLKAYHRLLEQTGNAQTISHFLNELKKTNLVFNAEIAGLKTDSTVSQALINKTTVIIDALNYQTNINDITFHIHDLNKISLSISQAFNTQSNKLNNAFNELATNKTLYKNYLPKFVWYGFHNQYHQWLFGGNNSKGIIRGDFGISYIKKEPVMFILKNKMKWSLFFSLVSIILAYLISIPIGIKIAQKPDSYMSKGTQIFLFSLYSMPSFFIGVLLLMLFANPDILSILPPSGIKPIEGYDNDTPLIEKIMYSLPYMILPLICYTYSSLAFISKLTTASIREQLPLDYIKTARAKGLSEKSIIWKHALKNGLLPLITVFSAVFPSIIGGSVIIESIYTIPGMGLETVRAIVAQDYPLVIAIITLSAFLTVVSYLLADILYAWADPRIRK